MRGLFVCTGNVFRSPLAMYVARQHYPTHQWDSCGVYPQDALNPLVAAYLDQQGVYHADFQPRALDNTDTGRYDAVILIGHDARMFANLVPEYARCYQWHIHDPGDACTLHYVECTAKRMREMIGQVVRLNDNKQI